VVPMPKSVAVLPFENLSADPDNAYFAEGIQEEILTRLASIAGLKVISRTSTHQYQTKPRNLGEIARQLGVAHILEGSVQKAADQVRVNVQLINAQTDSHLWADTYDRKLIDIFGVESDIAKAIAAALQAKLTGREEQALAVKPTNNPEAYDAYLRGLAVMARWPTTPDVIEKAAGLFEQAVQLDPKFAVAWARLSGADADLYFNGLTAAAAARGPAAKLALEQAQKLEPNSPETQVALGYYQYFVLHDFGAAKTTFERVSKMLPNSSEIAEALAEVARRQGRWDESIAHFDRALALDPRNVQLFINTASTYAMLQQFPRALKLYDRALDIEPNDPDLMAAKAGIYQAQGDLGRAAKFLSNIDAETQWESGFFLKTIQLRLERNYIEAVRLLQARLTQFHFVLPFDKDRSQIWLALIQLLAGNTAGAKMTAEESRNIFEQRCRDQPDNYFFAERLSRAYAVMGQKEPALAAAERAVMLNPRARDAMLGPRGEENLALILTMVGERSRAISTLNQLLETPYRGGIYYQMPITPALLRLDPIWDPLRSDPTFQKLCEEKQP
jgi:TolB-like protein/Tfp pilus assembly protein PilF